MKPLFKKTGDKVSIDLLTAWHPNFRNKKLLPDIKTVRTNFFINLVAITTVVVLGLFIALREIKLAAFKHDLANKESDIAAANAPSEKAKADFKNYSVEEQRFKTAYELVEHPFRFSDFVTHMGTILPNGVKINLVDFRGVGQTMNVSGNVRGLDASSSDIASNFIKLLQTDLVLSKDFSTITLTNLGRDVAQGNMSLELVFTFKALPTVPVKK